MIGLGGIGKVFRKIFGSRNERLLKAYQKRVDVINEHEPTMRGDYDTRFAGEAMKLAADMPPEDKPAAVQRIRVELSADLHKKTEELRERLAKGEDVSNVLPEAFAACREASRRAQNHRRRAHPQARCPRRRAGRIHHHHAIQTCIRELEVHQGQA